MNTNVIFKKSTSDLLQQYIDLYKLCFPNSKRYTSLYLKWMYYQNPIGAAIGIDALYRGNVVGQVIAIPGQYLLHGDAVRALLAVNVAVRPDFQGRDLFMKLGLQLCNYAADEKYTFIIGVANAAATPGWTRKMGFQLVTPLNAWLGFGNLNLNDSELIFRTAGLRHLWTPESIEWRVRNPISFTSLEINPKNDLIRCYASTGTAGLSAYAEIPNLDIKDHLLNSKKYKVIGGHVFIGLIPGGRSLPLYFNIPNYLKPSPLNLIYKNLTNESDRLDMNDCFFNYLDFDAF